MKTYDEIVKELDEKIPRDVISLRDGGGGRKLSYLEGWYVIDRLNKVIGHGNWAYTSDVQLLHSGQVDGRSGSTFSVHYSAKVRLVVTIGDKPTEFTDYGYGDGTDRGNPGKAHELAIKEAVTDGLKRCAKNLGMSFGLALYDKSQENVDDGNEQETSSKIRSDQSPGVRNSAGEILRAKPGDTQGPAKRDEKVANAPVEKKATNVAKEEDLKKLIVSTAKVIVAKKVKTLDQLCDMIEQEHKVAKKETLTLQVAQLTLDQINLVLKQFQELVG